MWLTISRLNAVGKYFKIVLIIYLYFVGFSKGLNIRNIDE